MKQIEINFDAGLGTTFPEFRDCVKASVYGCGRALKAVAADLDMSSSALNRKLTDNPNDPVDFPLRLLPELMEATGDLKPLYWLIERFLEGSQDKQTAAMQELAHMMPKLQQLIEQAGS